MTCPISCPISCFCQCADTTEAETSQPQSSSNPTTSSTIITRQPSGTMPSQMQGEGYINPVIMSPTSTVLDTIQKAGSLVSELINSPTSQRSFRSCRDNCNRFCCSSTPSWLRCIFECCCTALINEDSDDENATNVVIQYLQNLRTQFGPIVLGLAIGTSGLNFQQMITNNQPLSSEQEQCLLQACHKAQEMYASLVIQSLQEPLTRRAEEIEVHSNETSEISVIVCKAILQHRKNQPIVVPPSATVILLPHESCGASTCVSGATANTSSSHPTSYGEEDEESLAQVINWNKLYQQLKHLPVSDLTNDDIFPLGSQARDVVDILKRSISLMSQGDPLFPNTSTGHYLHAPLFLKILSMVLAGCGYIPVKTDNSYLNNHGELRTLGLALLEAANERMEQDEEDRTDSSASLSIPTDPTDSRRNSLADETHHIVSPSAQERLLRACQKARSVYSIILG